MKLLGITFVMIGAIVASFGWVVVDNRFEYSDLPELIAEPRRSSPGYRYSLAATFTLCDGAVRENCVVDGDTFWFRGDKIRIADIDTPEISEPNCPDEKDVGELARDRLLMLLNEGASSFAAGSRDADRHGRKLRTVWRSGESLGIRLVEEGLARRWNGSPVDWCGS
jgi:micrococcal nuclease